MAALLGAAALVAGCHPEDASTRHVNYVVVGDSLSAGHQNGCTVASQQTHGYANVIAEQAGWDVTLPLIGEPGVRPCMEILESGNPLSIQRVDVGGDPNDPSTWGDRLNPLEQPTNLGTSGTRMVDAFSAPPDSSFHLMFGLDYASVWQRFLDTPDHTPDRSMVDQAVDLIGASGDDQDVVVFWLGSNDALWSAIGGVSIALTPQADFQTAYHAALWTLVATGAKVVTANVPDLTTTPHFVPAELALSWFGTDLATAGATLGLSSGDYVTFTGLTSVYMILSGLAPPPLADTDFLTPTEVADIQAAIAGYNQIITSEAQALHVPVVDIAGLLADAKANGYPVGSETLTTDFCGGIFSLDGVHPTNTAYAIVANEFITTMNSAWHLNIPQADLVSVRADEPAKNRCIAGA